MKRFICAVTALLVAGAVTSFAREGNSLGDVYGQTSPKAISLRVGYGVSVSWQQYLAEDRVMIVDLDIPGFVGIGVSASHDWINPFNTEVPWVSPEGEWNWYLGAGIGGGVDLRKPATGYLGLLGRLGVEYEFDFPMTLGLEYRPNFGAQFCSTEAQGGGRINTCAFYAKGLFANAFAICLRYRF